MKVKNMHFAVTCYDKKDSLELRMANREAHLLFVRTDAIKIIAGGPLFDDEEKMIGSILLVDAIDRAALDLSLAADPYAKAGLFETVTIHPMKVALVNLI